MASRPPRTEAERMEIAFEQLKREHEIRAADTKRRQWHRPDWVDRRLLMGLGVVLLLLIADGVRRENGEFRARVQSVSGAVSVSREGTGASPLRAGDKLEAGCRIATEAGAQTAIEFADSSVVVVGQSSQITLRALEYSRGGRYRDRSLYLSYGECWASVSRRFGVGSEMAIHTPSAVVAAQGGRFYVAHLPSSGASWIACGEGRVSANSYGAVRMLPAMVDAGFQWGADRMQRTPGPIAIQPQVQQSFAQHNALDLPPSKDPLMQRVEYVLNNALDPVLSIIGVGKCSWGVGTSNAARRSTAMEALRLLRTHLEGEDTYPRALNPVTLEELHIDEKEVGKILGQFRGNMLDSYVCMDNGSSYMVGIRAKDRASTPMTMTPMEITIGGRVSQ